MRLRLLVVALLAALAVAPAAHARLVVERTGGIAGVQDRLVVRADGSGLVTHRGGPRERLTPADTRAVRRALRHAGFADLDARYEPTGTVADAF
ncbi:MAG TPA: hypothetical protein VIL49_00425, partial [Capillimicrobium sp.]